MKKYRVYKNGRLILEKRFYSIEHAKKYLKSKFNSGIYDVQELSVYKDNDVKTIHI